MPNDFDDYLALLDDTPFEEDPVDVVTFVEDKQYLGLPPLSEIQYTIVESMSQIYRVEDLIELLGDSAGREHYKKYTKKEVILKLGKGSGKDHVSTIGCAYIVHKLLCLKDPAGYFGKPEGDAIDILNVAINAQQAKNVFFKGFKTKVKNSPWFRGKYDAKIDYINFDKSITVYSGHSERESHEGLNIILAILDEISGFAIDNPSGIEKAKTADAIYNAFRGTVDSRFGMGKVVLLSFPRHNNCFISQRYADAVADKYTVKRSHTFIIDPDRPHDDPDNIFVLDWEEDHVTSYRFPGLYALCRPTWEVNPTKTIDDFLIPFVTNENDARTRFLAQPVMAADAFFGIRERIDSSLVLANPLDTSMRPLQSLQPKPYTKYYMHADLAQKVDRCAVALSHVDKWVSIEYQNGFQSIRPYVVTDAIAYWKPGEGNPLDLTMVKDWVIMVRSLGFDIDLITFDRWGAVDMQRDLMQLGFQSETLSVAKKHYEDMMVIMYEGRLKVPYIDVLQDELYNLRVVKDKVDHPYKSGKDLSDALCGSVFNAATRSPMETDIVVEVHDITTPKQEKRKPFEKELDISSYDDWELSPHLL